ncbi:hypothetical protein [Planktothrix agardhii]|uniref:hypothetical protein n=1 Tax=Planktothrix agardhii TaxID=1160 RepID=UPI001F256B3F|nr:hypothetical protein [Planktothrix agardhii]MCF3647548.1 hypothetical protein [Planktothrix agardhii 1026]
MSKSLNVSESEILIAIKQMDYDINDIHESWEPAIANHLTGTAPQKLNGTSPKSMQSHNTEAIGIDGKFRNNFLLVLCGASARGEIQNIWKHDDPRFLRILNVPYPVVVCGSNPHQIAEHPTHKHHSRYLKKGNLINHQFRSLN